MKNSLVFAILIYILNKGKVSRGELSLRFEISPNSVVRYVTELMNAGIPVYSSRGPNGGYCISEDFRLSSTFFSPEEKKRLIALIETSRHLFDDQLTATVIDKIENIAKRKHIDYTDDNAIILELEFDEAALIPIKDWLGVDYISRNGQKYYAQGAAPANETVGKLLSLGAHVKVLSPKYVREAILSECANIITRCS